MTDCNTCLGCQAQEGESVKEKYHCPNYVDGREPEGQIEMEETPCGVKA